MNKDKALEDFKLRIKHYEELYETMDEEKEAGYSFMKIFNTGDKILVHKHEGHIQSRIVYYLMVGFDELYTKIFRNRTRT